MTPPVLFLIFNRPELVARAFAQIRHARPVKLYVAADGPRPSDAGDVVRCGEARRLAAAVDWPCEIKTLFREENLGCRRSVSSAITWFFEHEEEGIIIEDDTLPDKTFFPYCAELLDRYRESERVMAICGGSHFPRQLASTDSYVFSRIFDPWGWATWRRAWVHYDDEMADLDDVETFDRIDKLGPGAVDFGAHWAEEFRRTRAGVYNSWAYRWTYSIMNRGGFVVVPNRNLVRNIGFGANATHTTSAPSALARLDLSSLSFPLKHPKAIRVGRRRERAALAVRHRVPVHSIGIRVRRFVRRLAINLIGARAWEAIRSIQAKKRY